MESAIIVTRSMNEQLSALADKFLALLPFDRMQIRDSAADMYFYALHSFEADWIINVDEDAFCFDPQRLIGLMEYMSQNDFHFCGMPDGGVLPFREHNPIVPNAFFNIFNMKAIRPKFQLEAAMNARLSEKLTAHTPAFARGTFAYDNFEPYYPYFFWLLDAGFRPLYLDAKIWEPDGMATLLEDHTGRPFLIHAWYAREFQVNPDRFMTIARYAREQLTSIAAS